MTEAEWLASTNPEQMLWGHLRSKISDRKMRLFGVACCRRIWHLLTDERSRLAVDIAERYADGVASEQELDDAWGEAYDVSQALYIPEERYETATRADYAAYYAHKSATMTSERLVSAAYEAAKLSARAVGELTTNEGDEPGTTPLSQDESAGQAMFVRDIVGNPFRSVNINQAWLKWNDNTIPKIAQDIYYERAFERMPILADALEDAGCDNADLLNHCRQPGEHVRGCWVVDLLLGKQ